MWRIVGFDLIKNKKIDTDMTFTALTPSDLEGLAPKILEAIGQRRIVAFDAPMGAGKTTLIKALCQALGSDSIVNSPTFAIVNDYELPSGESVFHFDLYRLKNLGEALDVGCNEYFDSGSYCFVEWPEVAADLLPDNACHISISVADNGMRTIIVDEE